MMRSNTLARDLAPAPDGFSIFSDGHGHWCACKGDGMVAGERLYQLVRQNGPVVDRNFEIRFLDPGVQAYAFTFG